MSGQNPQKGGKKKEQLTSFEISEDIYDGYYTPTEPEIETQHKTWLQKIKHY